MLADGTVRVGWIVLLHLCADSPAAWGARLDLGHNEILVLLSIKEIYAATRVFLF